MITMTIKRQLPEEINITIPYKGKTIDDEKYIDVRNCYLAEQLRRKGYDNILVGRNGITSIEGATYYPTKEFGRFIVALYLSQGDSIKVTLKKSKNEI